MAEGVAMHLMPEGNVHGEEKSHLGQGQKLTQISAMVASKPMEADDSTVLLRFPSPPIPPVDFSTQTREYKILYFHSHHQPVTGVSN